MIEYWYYTGDDQYNKWITEGLQFQVGPNNDFEPINQTRTEVRYTCEAQGRFNAVPGK